MIIDERKGLPINFFFYKDERGLIKLTLNGAKYPNRRTLIQISSIVSALLSVKEDKIKKWNKEIEKRQQEEIKRFEKECEAVKIPRKKEGYIYLIRSLDLYKIGRCSSLNRIKTYRTENPHGIKLLLQVKVLDCVKTEKVLLKKYSKKQYKGEWFNLEKKDVLEIKKFLNG